MKKTTFMLIFYTCLSMLALGRTKTEITHDKEQTGFEKSWADFILTIEKEDQGVRIRSNGYYVKRIMSNQSLTNDFVLSLGETFQMAPDHHASAIFTLTNITSDGIYVRYESSFDHRSFGKDLISKDLGEFYWPFAKAKQ